MSITREHPDDTGQYKKFLPRAPVAGEGRMPLVKSCLRCGRRFIRTGRAFKITCAEGRVVDVDVCRACATLSELSANLGEMRRAI